MEVQHQVACRDVVRGDAIELYMPKSGGDCRATVSDVKVIGVNVRIDTGIGVSQVLPVNRSITVWRSATDAAPVLRTREW